MPDDPKPIEAKAHFAKLGDDLLKAEIAKEPPAPEQLDMLTTDEEGVSVGRAGDRCKRSDRP